MEYTIENAVFPGTEMYRYGSGSTICVSMPEVENCNCLAAVLRMLGVEYHQFALTFFVGTEVDDVLRIKVDGQGSSGCLLLNGTHGRLELRLDGSVSVTSQSASLLESIYNEYKVYVPSARLRTP